MKFKVVSADATDLSQTNDDPKVRIEGLIESSPVFLFMKGTPEAPQCGFSYRVCEVLRGWKVPFRSFNVLADPDIRQGIKEFTNWPTIPQLYVNREFVGGCDIIEELSQSGELRELLQEAYPEQNFEPPPPPARSACATWTRAFLPMWTGVCAAPPWVYTTYCGTLPWEMATKVGSMRKCGTRLRRSQVSIFLERSVGAAPVALCSTTQRGCVETSRHFMRSSSGVM